MIDNFNTKKYISYLFLCPFLNRAGGPLMRLFLITIGLRLMIRGRVYTLLLRTHLMSFTKLWRNDTSISRFYKNKIKICEN